MSDAGKTQILPAITGNPRADALWRYAAAAVGALVAGIAIGWANAHGFDFKALAKLGIDMPTLIAQAATGLVIATVATVMGYRAVGKSEAAVVNNTVAAALTGVVPLAIAAKASEAQAAAIDASPTATIANVPPAPATKS